MTRGKFLGCSTKPQKLERHKRCHHALWRKRKNISKKDKFLQGIWSVVTNEEGTTTSNLKNHALKEVDFKVQINNQNKGVVILLIS